MPASNYPETCALLADLCTSRLKLLKLFDLLEDPPTIYDPDYYGDYDKKVTDAYGGKEKLVELMHASIDEYYGGWLARHSKGGKPEIGFIDEYHPNRPSRFWKSECTIKLLA